MTTRRLWRTSISMIAICALILVSALADDDTGSDAGQDAEDEPDISTVCPTAPSFFSDHDEVAPANGEEAADESAGPFDARLLEIARAYRSYGRVDDQSRWAPVYCRAPSPSVARRSRSDDDGTHGRKLYFLFAKNQFAYLLAHQDDVEQTDQVVVKEAWRPNEVTEDVEAIRRSLQQREFIRPESQKLVQRDDESKQSKLGGYVPYVQHKDKVYRADQLSDLFIMYKTDADTPDTDDDWVYGTVTADGQQVTSSGRVESCMGCHQDAPHGRLFGVHAE